MSFHLISAVILCFSITSLSATGNFSKTYSKFFNEEEEPVAKGTDPNVKMWEMNGIGPFNELIVSWNARRPLKGKMVVWVSVKHSQWSRWHRLAMWGPKYQRTFVNKLDPYVHTKHVLVEMQKGRLARGFRVKVGFEGGADPQMLQALFACTSNMKHFKISRAPINKPSIMIQDVPRQSQMIIAHPRCKEFCSPTATSLLVNYFRNKILGHRTPRALDTYVKDFASKVHDNGYLNIYGNWLLNVAQAYDSTDGNVFFRVERLNSFHDLYAHLENKIPVVVSVRRLPGGATPYSNGHLMVVVGWHKESKSVICIDPAFARSIRTLKRYPVANFLKAWGLSRNLSYIPILKKGILNWA